MPASPSQKTLPLVAPPSPPRLGENQRKNWPATGNSFRPEPTFSAKLGKTIHQDKTVTTGQDTAQNTTKTQGQQGTSLEDDFDFFDFLDILNPLQHIPVVSTFYRELTGDELHPASRIVGGTLYGAIPGAVSAVLNTITEGITGKDIGEHIADAFFGEDDSPTPRTAQTPQQAPRETPPDHTRHQITTSDAKTGEVKTGDAALAALYQDLRQAKKPPTQATGETPPPKQTAKQAPTLTADTTLAAFTRPGEQPPPQASAFFVENDRKWFHLKQAGNQQFVNTVRVQPPSFSPRRTLVDDPITQSIEHSRATENNLMDRNNRATQRYQNHTPPADLAAQMRRNLDRYEALKAGKPTQSAQGLTP